MTCSERLFLRAMAISLLVPSLSSWSSRAKVNDDKKPASSNAVNDGSCSVSLEVGDGVSEDIGDSLLVSSLSPPSAKNRLYQSRSFFI